MPRLCRFRGDSAKHVLHRGAGDGTSINEYENRPSSRARTNKPRGATTVERAADPLHSSRINDHQSRKRDLNRVGDSSRVSKLAADRRSGAGRARPVLFYAFQKLKNRGVESLRLLKLRKVTTLVEYDLL
jgi:hypothetical protein